MPGDRITAMQKAYAHFLRTKAQASYSEIAKLCKISKSSSQRICKEAVNETKSKRECKTTGRPRKLDERNERILIRTLKTLRLREPNVSVRSLMIESGLDASIASRRTVSRILNEHGYGFFTTKKEGNIVRER